jgi:hypothetical protein
MVVGLAGCATQTQQLNDRSAESLPLAVFTGKFVDGLPLYRLPRMEVIGSRSSIGPDS